MKRLDLTGKRFGRLTVVGFSYTKRGRAHWLCQCDCGAEKAIRGTHLKSGASKSCGCYNKEASSRRTGPLSFMFGKTGELSPTWKGGKFISKSGYRFVLMPWHPYANCTGYILEHRLVFESTMMRFLSPEEVIHHVNGHKNDNRFENLRLFPSKAEHTRFHQLNELNAGGSGCA